MATQELARANQTHSIAVCTSNEQCASVVGSNQSRIEQLELAGELDSVNHGPVSTFGIHHAATVYFPTSGTALDTADAAVCIALIDSLRASNLLSEASIEVSGFADARGPAEVNDQIACQRAQSAADALDAAADGLVPITTAGWGEEPVGTAVEDALGRRADIVVEVCLPDPRKKRAAAGADLSGMIDQALVHLAVGGGRVDARTARLLELVEDPSVDGAYVDPGSVVRYVLEEQCLIGITPDDVARDVRRDTLDQVAYAGGDVEAFLYGMRNISRAIFDSIEAVNRYYNINGEEYSSARILHRWTQERQRSPSSILSAHQE